jgi:hypothetical protein
MLSRSRSGSRWPYSLNDLGGEGDIEEELMDGGAAMQEIDHSAIQLESGAHSTAAPSSHPAPRPVASVDAAFADVPIAVRRTMMVHTPSSGGTGSNQQASSHHTATTAAAAAAAAASEKSVGSSSGSASGHGHAAAPREASSARAQAAAVIAAAAAASAAGAGGSSPSSSPPVIHSDAGHTGEPASAAALMSPNSFGGGGKSSKASGAISVPTSSPQSSAAAASFNPHRRDATPSGSPTAGAVMFVQPGGAVLSHGPPTLHSASSEGEAPAREPAGSVVATILQPIADRKLDKQ